MYFPERFKKNLPKNKSPEELDKYHEEIELEKGDFLAMVIAAVITFLPVLIVVMVVIYGLLFLFLGV
ncbi:MAG: hypothetical protein FWE14_05940 [Lachnospiraceae bacterium]|nr:hypothetical protein [Lachnospiraceae bacterium]